MAQNYDTKFRHSKKVVEVRPGVWSGLEVSKHLCLGKDLRVYQRFIRICGTLES